jgi:S-formylglutathione hydrolase FrmB
MAYLAFVPRKALREDEKLPVLYLLHGEDGSWTDFPEHAHGLLQALATKHSLVIVTPGSAEGSSEGSPLVESVRRQTALLFELMPDVEQRLPVLPRRGVGGVSLGGNEAVLLALKNPGVFASVSSMSGTLDLVETNVARAKESGARVLDSSSVELARAKPDHARALTLLLTVGSSDPWAKSSRALDDVLTEQQVPHELRMSPGGHDWSHWLEVLPAHVEWHASVLREASDRALPHPASERPGPP